jgi:hypothetical protein
VLPFPVLKNLDVLKAGRLHVGVDGVDGVDGVEYSMHPLIFEAIEPALTAEIENLGRSSNHDNNQIMQPTRKPIATATPWRWLRELATFATCTPITFGIMQPLLTGIRTKLVLSRLAFCSLQNSGYTRLFP